MSLNYRRDNRSIETFANNIKDFTKRESIWAECVRITFEEKTGKFYRLLNNGVDNMGDLIIGTLANYNPDYKLIASNDKEYEFDIKTIPERYINSFMTFKKHSVITCIQHNAAFVVPTKNYFYWLTSNILCLIQQVVSAQIWSGFSPNDLAYRITQDKYQKLKIHKINWSQKGQLYVNEHWHTLSKEKVK